MQLIHQEFNKHSSVIQFPDFKKVELSDKDIIEKYVENFPPYSDFNFVSLWSYNTNDEAEYTFLNKNFVLKFNDYITNEPFYTFLGKHNLKETIDTLLRSAEIQHMNLELKLIPEVVIEELNKEPHNFKVVDDEDNHDYIYKLKDIISLEGGKYRQKRQLIRKFGHIYKSSVFHTQQPDEKIISQMLEIFEKWCDQKNISRKDYLNELLALKRCLQLTDIAHLNIILIYIDDKPVAFNISQPVHHNYVVAHFGKTLKYTGVWETLIHEESKLYHNSTFEFGNHEQDLGIPELRMGKKLWNPSHYLKKYIITNK